MRSLDVTDSMRGYQSEGSIQRPYLAVVILSFEDSDRTLRCLESVRNQLAEGFEILVIDNGSRDGSADIIRRHLRDRERLIVLRSNMGFAGGMNAGLSEAISSRAGFSVLLNNDTVLEAGVLGELLQFMESHKEVGVSGPRIHLLSNPDTPQFPRYLDMETATDDPGLSGAAFIIRMEAVSRTRLFDETYFFLWEDKDLFQTILQAGWRVVYLPTRKKVLHEVHATSGKRGGLTLYYFLRNEFLYKRRWEPGIGTLLRTTRSQIYGIFSSRNSIRRRVKALIHGWIFWLRNPGPRTSWGSPSDGLLRPVSR